ncbi:MAG: ATP-dependent helicase HrpB [Fibrobacter sp.]|nr:ATP-dependent helicase HrpB [Fibrobacter sp.]
MSNSLPIFQNRDSVISALHDCNRLIVKAPTGSGKSTQIPQMLLDSGLIEGTILVLQPRRLAARMLASRVAFERGTEPGQEIGFQTRFESQISETTRVKFITEGILPRMLLSDKLLSGVSVVIFDEFHERSLTVDLGLALIRQLQENLRPDLKLVVMSATLDTGPLIEYLPGAALINSEGRTFPVSIQHYSRGTSSEPWVLAAEAASQLIRNGAEGDLLVFMPGLYEIRRTVSALQESRLGEPVQISMLYGDLSSDLQQQVMEPCGKRKIIVATNIAETSLTIPGVRHVIDSGLARVNRYDPVRGFNTLYVEKIGIDSAGQRAGRAGREAPGTCVRLWSQTDHQSRPQRTPPEILRVDLAETVLQLKMLGYSDPASFPWMESPGAQSINAALELLEWIGAIDQNGVLTENGMRMADFPMHPRLASLLLESHQRGVIRKGTFACAVLSERPAVSTTPDLPDEILRQCEGSDFSMLEYVVDKVSESGFDPGLCRKWNVNVSAVKAILRTEAYYLQICRKKRMHTQDRESGAEPLSLSILAAYADRLARRRDQGTLQCELSGGRRGELSKDSLARGSRLIVAASINELKSKQQTAPRTVLSLACGIKEQWLNELFPDKIKTETELVWNSIRQAVEEKNKTVCLGVTISETVKLDPDPEKAGDLLADTIINLKLPLSGWNSEVQDFLNRSGWVREQFPECGTSRFGDEEYSLVIHELCRNEFRFESVKNHPVLPLVMEFFPGNQRSLIERTAPPFFVNREGRKLRVTYKQGSAPVIRAKIQDLYGMSNYRAAEGRVSVVFEILAPNMRPVQVTDDLDRFWKVHYPELKKTLARKYPKHKWL